MALYLSKHARDVISTRMLTDDLQNEYVIIDGQKTPIAHTPTEEDPANIMGLMMLSRLSLQLTQDTFSFASIPSYF
jgi:hypothetical protein